MIVNSISQSQAWRRMHSLRGCPTLDVLRGNGEAARRHLAGCPLCRDMLERESVYASCGQLLARRAGHGPAPTPVTKGDIRRVKPLGKPGDWFDIEGRYHNPPLVLVLENPDSMGFVRVAQIFDESDLTDKGDVPLYDDAPVYAEAWNVYGLPLSGLAGTAFRHVDMERVENVSRACSMDFPDLDPSSALYHFRIGEVELGSFFSVPLNAARLEELETNPESCADKVSFEQKIKEIGQKIGLESIPLAAAESIFPDDGADRLVRAVCVLLPNVDDFEQYSVFPAEAHLFCLPNECVCAAYCKPDPCPVATSGVLSQSYGAGMYLGSEAASEVSLEWLGDGAFRAHGKFSSLPGGDAEIRVVIYKLGEAAQN